MKILIQYKDKTNEVELEEDSCFSTLKQKMIINHQIQNQNLIITTEVEGSISYPNDNEKIALYVLSESTTFIIEESKAKIFHQISHSILDLRANPEYFDKWVTRAIKYCRDNNFEKFVQLQDEFAYSTFNTLKEKSFGDLINTCQSQGWNCLHYVCKNGHSGILQLLIDNGAECNLETEDGWTPLSLVCHFGYILCARLLLNQSSIQVNKKTVLKGTALHQACLGGNIKVVKLLMDSNSSPYIENSEGLIPLQLTKKLGILELIPRYIGAHFLNKYAKSASNKPENYSGELYWTTDWQINDKLVLLVLDIDNGIVFQYDLKDLTQPQIQIPVSEVQDIQNYEESLNENRFFLQIRTLKETFKYYSRTFEVAKTWVSKIREALAFYQENSDNDVQAAYRMNRFLSVYNFDEVEKFEEFDEDNLKSVSFASFEIVQEVGAGSFGTVFKVIKKDNGKRYAMKVLSKVDLKRNGQLKYVIAECKILKKLSSPFIIPLHWAFQTPNNIYMVFEFCPHGDLSNQIPPTGLPESKVRAYMSEIVLSLEYLHAKNILFRDLKPSNVLIDETCHIKLSDFGLARENINKRNLASTFCGSPSYIAPEVLSNSGQWKPADLYSLGICLYELLVGRPPFTDPNQAKLFQSIVNNKISFPSHLSSQSKNLIQLLTHKNPEKRPTIEEIKNHGFFEGVKWGKVQSKQAEPPVWLEESSQAAEQAYLDDRDYSMTQDQRISQLLI